MLTRQKKRDSLDPDKLKQEWLEKLSPYEIKAIAETHHKAASEPEPTLPDHSARHLATAFRGLMDDFNRVTEERLINALKAGGVR